MQVREGGLELAAPPALGAERRGHRRHVLERRLGLGPQPPLGLERARLLGDLAPQRHLRLGENALLHAQRLLALRAEFLFLRHFVVEFLALLGRVPQVVLQRLDVGLLRVVGSQAHLRERRPRVLELGAQAF